MIEPNPLDPAEVFLNLENDMLIRGVKSNALMCELASMHFEDFFSEDEAVWFVRQYYAGARLQRKHDARKETMQ